MNLGKRIITVYIMTFVAVVTILSGQVWAEDILNIYLDCRRCDRTFIRTEINFVNFVTERQEADVHLLITRRNTGGGGEERTLAFIGQRSFTGVNDTLVYTTAESDTRDIRRNEMVRVMELGLVRYAMKTPTGERLSVSFQKPEGEKVQIEEDKWRNWVFRINMNSFLNGEASRNSTSIYGTLSARKVTEEWKARISVSGNYYEDNFNRDDENYKSISRRNTFYSYVIRSISDHWSTGIWAAANSTTYGNINLELSMDPRIEYNYYPYSESTRRQLTFVYAIGPEYVDYSEETIYGKFSENLIEESFAINMEQIQTWGSAEIEIRWSNYMHDFNKNELEISGDINMQILKGFSLNMFGSYSRIHNQLSLPRDIATIEETLLRRKELETQYNYWGSVGFSYSFGSIYNNIVNTRFSH